MTSPFPEPPMLLNFLVVMFVFAGAIVYIITQRQATTQQRRVAAYLDTALRDHLSITIIDNAHIKLHESPTGIVEDTLEELTAQQRKLVPTTATLSVTIRNVDNPAQQCQHVTAKHPEITVVDQLTASQPIPVTLHCHDDHTDEYHKNHRYETQYSLSWLLDQPPLTSSWGPMASHHILTTPSSKSTTKGH